MQFASDEAKTAPENFQLELLDMQLDVKPIPRQAFQSEGLLAFWSRVPEEKYPNLLANGLKIPLYLDHLMYVKHFQQNGQNQKPIDQ